MATRLLRCRSICFELLHGLAGLTLDPAELLHVIALFNGKPADEALIPLDIVHMQVDLLLKDYELLLHLNFQIVTCSLNLSLHLDHFFFLQ